MIYLNAQVFRFNYTNYRGDSSIRIVSLTELFFGSTAYHPTPQWLMTGHDFGKNAERTFALADMRPIDTAPVLEPADPKEAQNDGDPIRQATLYPPVAGRPTLR